MKYAFIQQHTRWAVKRWCAVLNLSRSAYYAWVGCQQTPNLRMRVNAQLLEHIKTVHQQFRQAYGAVKTWQHLNHIGISCGKHRVARLRQQAGIEAKRKQRFRITVEHHKMPAAAPDLVQRQFSTAAPNHTWVGDMTFIRTRQGWLHLAVLLDLYSCKVVGGLWVRKQILRYTKQP